MLNTLCYVKSNQQSLDTEKADKFYDLKRLQDFLVKVNRVLTEFKLGNTHSSVPVTQTLMCQQAQLFLLYQLLK